MCINGKAFFLIPSDPQQTCAHVHTWKRAAATACIPCNLHGRPSLRIPAEANTIHTTRQGKACNLDALFSVLWFDIHTGGNSPKKICSSLRSTAHFWHSTLHPSRLRRPPSFLRSVLRLRIAPRSIQSRFFHRWARRRCYLKHYLPDRAPPSYSASTCFRHFHAFLFRHFFFPKPITSPLLGGVSPTDTPSFLTPSPSPSPDLYFEPQDQGMQFCLVHSFNMAWVAILLTVLLLSLGVILLTKLTPWVHLMLLSLHTMPPLQATSALPFSPFG